MQELLDKIRRFNSVRDWEKFHSPKNLAIALLVEAAEVAEHLQWITEEESRSLTDSKREAIEAEVGDVLICLVNLADKLRIESVSAALRKVDVNERKYPVERAKGNARKWDEHK